MAITRSQRKLAAVHPGGDSPPQNTHQHRNEAVDSDSDSVAIDEDDDEQSEIETTPNLKDNNDSDNDDMVSDCGSDVSELTSISVLDSLIETPMDSDWPSSSSSCSFSEDFDEDSEMSDGASCAGWSTLTDTGDGDSMCWDADNLVSSRASTPCSTVVDNLRVESVPPESESEPDTPRTTSASWSDIEEEQGEEEMTETSSDTSTSRAQSPHDVDDDDGGEEETEMSSGTVTPRAESPCDCDDAISVATTEVDMEDEEETGPTPTVHWLSGPLGTERSHDLLCGPMNDATKAHEDSQFAVLSAWGTGVEEESEFGDNNSDDDDALPQVQEPQPAAAASEEDADWHKLARRRALTSLDITNSDIGMDEFEILTRSRAPRLSRKDSSFTTGMANLRKRFLPNERSFASLCRTPEPEPQLLPEDCPPCGRD
ncbi:hypothetical protein BC835DRAFT_1409964 [Cytidiella melzeri]|nr:hypothetical protein BC835DRAFT_1409964 [Cytidiella melzeri]